jgi:hypothetical protein
MSTPITTPAQAFLIDSPEVQTAIHNDVTVDGYWLPVSFVPDYKIKSIVWFDDKRYVKLTDATNNATNPSLNAADWMELDLYLKSTVLVNECITTELLSTTDLILPENTELSELDYFEDSLKPASTNLTKNALKKTICEDTTEGIKIVDLVVSIPTGSAFDIDTDGTFYYTNPNDSYRIYKKKYNEIGAGTPTTNVGGLIPRIISNYLFFSDVSTGFLKRKDKNTIDDGIFVTNLEGYNPVQIDSENLVFIGNNSLVKKQIISTNPADFSVISQGVLNINSLSGLQYTQASTLFFSNADDSDNVNVIRTDAQTPQSPVTFPLTAGINTEGGFCFYEDFFIFVDEESIISLINLKYSYSFSFVKKICSGFYPRIIEKNKLIYQKTDGIYLKNLFIL